MAKKDYQSWSKEELLREIKKIEKQKEYGILWEDKPEQVALLCKEKLPVLAEDKSKEIVTDKDKPNNILIEGDNYHALSVLNYTHKGKIDVIYIDPPYNTGNKDFVYNDDYVDLEDPYRHSKWISFMEKRLRLAKNLLKKSGVIFISINDNEVAQLKLLMDGLYDDKNFVALLVWENREGGGSSDSKHFKIKHEYILIYARDISILNIKGVDIEDEDRYTLEDKYVKERGKHQLIKLNSASIQYSKSLDYPIAAPDGTNIVPSYGKKRACWRWSKEKLEWGIKNGFVVIKKGQDGKWAVYTKQYLKVDNEGNQIKREKRPIGVISHYSSTMATKELENLFQRKVFDYPKPFLLIKYLLSLSSDKNSTILDFFVGTGTTGHAVLELNKEDDGKRKFILCTNNEDNNGSGLKICTDICYPRIKKVIQNLEKESKNKLVKNMPGNLKYFKTDFVDAETSDRNKHKMVDKSTEMLCLKEDCFDEVMQEKSFRLFTNSQNKNLGIIYDDDGIVPFKKEIKKLKKKFVVYVFSLDESAREDEFEDVADWVELKPIPAVILNVYKRIFK